jgi:hypothetical protein
MLGGSLTLKPGHAPYLTIAGGVPLASISISSDHPLTSIDRSGLGDAFVQPLRIGWRFSRYDISAGYTFYAPTGRFEPRGGGGIGRGFWTHQISAGGAVFNKTRQWRASALASYDINGWKRGIDIKRGNTLQVQGGAGVTLSGVLVGAAGFALWQVTDDLGADLPPALRGLRTRGYALGPELGVAIVPMRLHAELRLQREFAARTRPEGYVLVAGLTYRAWVPPPRSERRVIR